MEYHIDRRIILNSDPQFKSLYDWSLQELDASGNKVGSEQIPWKWTLYFTATQVALGNAFVIEPHFKNHSDEETSASRERQFIHVKLHPGYPRVQGRSRETSYSMFGTDRTISSFDLYIEKLDDPNEQERCTVWGSASYTSENDFRYETTDDCVVFYLYVRAEKFARYAERVASCAVDEAVFRVGGVAGFYSGWSPSISTSEIKVLTTNEEHKVEIPTDYAVVPPRLGKVMDVELYFRRVLTLEKTGLEASDDTNNDENFQERTDKTLSRNQPVNKMVTDISRATDLLSSLRTVAWIIAAILFLILISNHN